MGGAARQRLWQALMDVFRPGVRGVHVRGGGAGRGRGECLITALVIVVVVVEPALAARGQCGLPTTGGRPGSGWAGPALMPALPARPVHSVAWPARRHRPATSHGDHSFGELVCFFGIWVVGPRVARQGNVLFGNSVLWRWLL